MSTTEIEEEDYRGILAILFGIGYFTTLGLALYLYQIPGFLAVASALTTPFSMVLKWYYEAKK